MTSRITAIVIMASVLGLVAGCASSRTIPMSVQSDPLGAYVVMKYKGDDNAESDWIFLGNTPLTTQRRFHKDHLTSNQILVLRLLKDGYLEQTKEWRGEELDEIRKDDGRLFWNPKLVPSN
ncbi:MAG: hypothetical protein U5R46_00240 [Gammaproteobacteria bacterium]|nr:hypothetical protein [Gammaproteobacteria bacterium]